MFDKLQKVGVWSRGFAYCKTFEGGSMFRRVCILSNFKRWECGPEG